MALISENFADVLDPRFRRIFNEEYASVPDKLDRFYQMVSGTLQTERWSSVGTYGVIPQFTGTVKYNTVAQGFDVAVTPVEFAAGIEIERRLFDDGLHNVIENKPRALSASLFRLRQTHAARPFNNAFTTDSLFYVHSEGVSLSSNSHTTNSGASTSTGFDNQVTTALSATALAAARIVMVQFRGDQAERIGVIPDTLVIPVDLYEIAFEIVASQGKVNTADNNMNVHFGQYTLEEWIYLTDTNNWFLTDSSLMKSERGLLWLDRNRGEMAFIEDFDTLIGKWRIYSRWAQAWNDWRWMLGANVS